MNEALLWAFTIGAVFVLLLILAALVAIDWQQDALHIQKKERRMRVQRVPGGDDRGGA